LENTYDTVVAIVVAASNSIWWPITWWPVDIWIF